MPSLTPKSVPVWTRNNTVQPHGSHCAQDLLFPLHGLQLHKLCLESGLSSFLPLPAYTASPVPAEICAALLTGPKFADSLSGTPHLPFYPDSVSYYVLKIYLVLWKKNYWLILCFVTSLSLFSTFPLYTNLFGILYLITSALGSLEFCFLFPVSGLLDTEAYFLMCLVSLYCEIRFGCF